MSGLDGFFQPAGRWKLKRSLEMADSEKVWPTGLTEAESEEIHRNLIQGTQFFGLVAAFAHLLAYIYSPWLG
jgi:light-harvesting protein B-800-850 beta chain